MRRGLAFLVVAAVLSGACQASVDISPTPPTTRGPLSSPPDPGNPPADDGFIAEDRALLASATVRVTGIACGRSTEGSGFAVGRDLIVTNAHVLVGVPEPTIAAGADREYVGSVVGIDLEQDLALIRVADANFVPLLLADAVDGQEGAIFGWEAGPTVDPTPFRVDRNVTVRIEAVASTERVERHSLLLAASIESGDSGAAVVSSEGVVIGVAYATSTGNRNAAYAVRSSEVERLISESQPATGTVAVPDC